VGALEQLDCWLTPVYKVWQAGKLLHHLVVYPVVDVLSVEQKHGLDVPFTGHWWAVKIQIQNTLDSLGFSHGFNMLDDCVGHRDLKHSVRWDLLSCGEAHCLMSTLVVWHGPEVDRINGPRSIGVCRIIP